jgi:hypothetical protein
LAVRETSGRAAEELDPGFITDQTCGGYILFDRLFLSRNPSSRDALDERKFRDS